MSDEKGSAGSVTLTPKMSFILGLVGGILVLCTIGFFILLCVVLKGGGVASDKPAKAVAQEEQPAAAAPAAEQPEDQVGEVAPVTAQDHWTGAKNADVVLITYSDFQCPYCARFHATMVEFINGYGDKVKWVMRNFPLSFHANAMPAANAAECAAEQGKYWEYVEKLFANQESLTEANFNNWTDDLGINASKFASCLSASKYQSRIDADLTGGQTAGISGTPATVILGPDGYKQLIPGALPLESVKAMVDQALNQ